MSPGIEKVLEAYQALIAEGFPTVHLEIDYDPEGEPFFNAFCVPDDREGELWDWIFDVLPDLEEKADLPLIGILPVSESETKQQYPGVCKHEAGTL